MKTAIGLLITLLLVGGALFALIMWLCNQTS